MKRNALAVFAGYAAAFEAPGFRVGEWKGGTPDEKGVVQWPWVDYSETVDRFVQDMDRVGLVHSFDWMRWQATERGSALMTDPAAVATAAADELFCLLTSVIRGERFGDGEIEAAFERGVVQAAARRAAELSAGRG